jgi:hypothetical protein
VNKSHYGSKSQLAIRINKEPILRTFTMPCGIGGNKTVQRKLVLL